MSWISSSSKVVNKTTLARCKIGSLLSTVVLITGCGALASPNSPDVIYSSNSSDARSLKVPPDLTDISNAEQLVLPGTDGSRLTRNTLLPQVDDVRFVREGGQSWLEFQQSPEDLWPQLIRFIRSEKYSIDQTEPVAGVISTQWRSAAGTLSVLRNLVSADDTVTRIAFRLERAAGGARLFARSQQAASDGDALPVDATWPASSHDPENTSALLNRLLAFLGVEQQKARGILDAEQARAVLDNAVVQSNAEGSEILINKSFQSAFNDMLKVFESLGYEVVSRDERVGRIEFVQAQVTPRVSMFMQLSPIHISAVRALVTDAEGTRLDNASESELLVSLTEQLV